MHTIWKHPIKITDIQDVFMPAGSRLLSVQPQFARPLGGIGDDGPPLVWQGWFEVPDTTAPAMRISVSVQGTGNPFMHDPGRYVCTSQDITYGMVWHFYTDDGAGS